MRLHTTLAATVLALAFAAPVWAKPVTRTVGGKRDPKKLGANALVAWRQTAGKPGRGAATAEEQTAAQIQKLLRTGPLREGQTGLFVVDARTGDPLFSVNPDDPLNPASNVKMISTATAIELLGPSYRYPTRLLGAAPDDAGVVHGDVYLLGSHDPTLAVPHLDDIGKVLSTRGITSIDGDLVIGSDPTRDAIYRGIVPITITAGDPGKPPIATVSSATSGGYDLVNQGRRDDVGLRAQAAAVLLHGDDEGREGPHAHPPHHRRRDRPRRARGVQAHDDRAHRRRRVRRDRVPAHARHQVQRRHQDDGAR
jgi:hypothetical protein